MIKFSKLKELGYDEKEGGSGGVVVNVEDEMRTVIQ